MKRIMSAVALGTAGALALAGPAAATHSHTPEVAEVSIAETCDGVEISIDGGGTNRGWRVLVGGEIVAPEGAALGERPKSTPPWGLWVGPEGPAVDIALDDVTLDQVAVEWHRTSHNKGWGEHEWRTTYTTIPVDPTECEADEPTPTPTPTPEPTDEPTDEPGEEPGGQAGGTDDADDTLPLTGSTTLLLAGGALALLAAGGGLFLVARRRRVTFQS